MVNKRTPDSKSGFKRGSAAKRPAGRKAEAGRTRAVRAAQGKPRTGGSVEAALNRKRPPVPLPEGLRPEDLLATSLQGLWIVDGEGRTTYASERMAEMLGCTAEEMTGRSYEDFTDSEWLPRARERFKERPGATRSTYEFLFRRKDGAPLWTLVSAQGMVDHDGRFLGAIGTLTDITDRKGAERALAESESRYRAFFEQSPDGVVILDPETTRPLEFNEAAHRQLGYTREEFASLSLSDIDAIETPEETRERVAAAQRRGNATFDTLQRTKTGSLRHVHVTAQIVEVKGRSLYHCVWRDVTDRKMAEQALAQSQSQLRALTDHMNEGLMRVDEEDRILYVNARLCDMLGYREEELLGRIGLQILVPEEDRAVIFEKNRSRKGGVSDRYRTRMRTKAGELLELEVSGSPVPATGDLPAGSIGIITDVTERVRAERAVREAQRFTQATLDGLADTICVVDERGTILAVNERWREFAKDNGDFSGSSFEGADYLAVCDRAAGPDAAQALDFAAGLRAVLNGEREQFAMEYPCHSPSVSRWFIARITRFPGKGPIRAVISHQNVTSRKLAERDLADSEQRYRTFLDATTDLAFLKDAEGRYLLSNAANTAYLGRGEEDILGRTDGDLMPPGLAASCGASDRAVLKGGRPIVTEERVGERVYQATKFPVPMPDGSLGVGGYVREVTDRKRAEEALRESAWRLESHVNNSPLAAIEFDREFRVTLWSTGAERIFGWGAAEILGKSIAGLRWVHDDDAASVAALSAEMFAGRKPSNIHRNRNYTKDGRVISCVWHNSALYDAEGNLLSVMSLVDDVTEREATQRALRESEERFRQVSESIMDVAYSCTIQPEGHYGIDWMTGATEAVLGLGVDQVKALGCWGHLVAEEDRTLFEEKVVGLSPGQEGVCDLRLRRPDGSTAWVASYCRRVEGAEGEGPLLYGALVDITARKEAEASSRRSEEQFRILAETIDEAYWIADPKIDKMVFISPAYERIWGRTCESLYQNPKSFMDAIHPDDCERTRQALLGFKEGENVDIEYRIVRPDGDVRWVRDQGFPYGGVEGKPLLYVGTVQDITERKQAEMTLRDSQARLDLALKSASMGTWYWDVRQNRRRFDGQACHLLGLDPSTFLGDAEEFYASVHPDDRERLKAAMAKTLQEDAPYQPEYRAVWTDGSVHHIAASARLIRDDAGEPSMVFGILWDITERRRAEVEIRRLNAELAVHLKQKTAELGATSGELDGFAHSVSHDLRAPLRGIDGWSQALLEDYGDRLDARGRGYLETVRSEAKHMGVLVDGLLEISRASRAEMKREPVDLSDLAHQARSALQRSEGGRTVEFVIPDTLEVEADPNLMRILVRHLMSNAWKFAREREGAVIEVGVRKTGGEHVFFVRDNGVGFDMAFAHKLFKPFQRLHPRERFPGVGIGLATVQRIVHRHGGRVWAEGKEGEGATFFFTLGSGSPETSPGGDVSRDHE